MAVALEGHLAGPQLDAGRPGHAELRRSALRDDSGTARCSQRRGKRDSSLYVFCVLFVAGTKKSVGSWHFYFFIFVFIARLLSRASI